MNKTQLIDAVAGKTGLSKTQTAKMLDALLATLEESLANGEPVQLVGFGSFSVNERGAARQGRHPPDRQTDGLARQKGRPLQTRHSIGECSR